MQSHLLIAYDRATHSGYDGLREAFLSLFTNDFIRDCDVEKSRQVQLMTASTPSAMPTGQVSADLNLNMKARKK